MFRVGLGLVAYKMSQIEIEHLSQSISTSQLKYKVVVDNSPFPNSKFLFEGLGWTYIHHSENPGFGTSHNFIFHNFAKNKVDYHVIVNPDITFEGDVIKRLIEFMENTLDAGCVMPKILYPDGNEQVLSKLLPKPYELMIRRLPLKFLKDRVNQSLEIRKDYDVQCSFKVPFVSGCFLLFRVDALVQCGFFDERFFLYAEDLDLSRRLWENGSFPYYFSGVSVNHVFKKGSSKNLKLFLTHIVSLFKYFNKWGWFDVKGSRINREFHEQFI